MIRVKDIPQVALRTALFALLKDGQTSDVYGDVPEKAALARSRIINSSSLCNRLSPSMLIPHKYN